MRGLNFRLGLSLTALLVGGGGGAASAPSLGGANQLWVAPGQSNQGAQGTAGTALPVASNAAMQALIDGTDSNVKVFNTGPFASPMAWQNYQVGVNSNPIQPNTNAAVTAASWSGGTVTLGATAHGFTGPSINITVYGMTPAAYNGIYTATVVDVNTLTYALAGNPGAATVLGRAAYQHYWGAELEALADFRTKYPSNKVWLYKQAPGGAQLFDGSDIASWNSRHTVATTSHWDLFRTWYAAALIASGGPTGTFKKIVWWQQGETEASTASGSPTKAAAYATDLANFAADIAAFMGGIDAFVIHQLFGTTTGNPGTLTANYAQCDTIRAAQASVAAALGAVGHLLDDAGAWTTVNGSSIHYPSSSIMGPVGVGARRYSVIAPPDVLTAGSLSGTRQVGQTLTYTPAVWNYTTRATNSWVWKFNGVTRQTGGLTYNPDAGDQGYAAVVVESMTAESGTTNSTLTDGSTIAAAPNEDAATTTLVNAAVAAGGSAPGTTRRAAVDALIAGLKSDVGNAGDSSSVWSHIVALEIIAGHDEIFAQMDWKSATKKVSVFHGTPTFVVDRGYSLNGTDQSLDTGLNPTTLGLATNNSGYGLWIAAGTGVTGTMGVNGAVAQRFGFNKAGSGVLTLQCQASAGYNRTATGAPLRATHHYVRRTVSTSIDYFNNGASDTLTAANTSGGGQNTNILLGQTGSTPTYVADRNFSFLLTDGGLDAAGIASLHSRLSAYKTTLGA